MRIRPPKRISWASGISLAVASGAALLLIMVRLLTRTEEPVIPFQRTIEDVELTWRCDAGHEFHAAGQVGPRGCWTCGRPAYPVTQFVCPVHGRFDVSVKFGPGQEGFAVPVEFRLQGRDWTFAEEPIECPRCRRPLTRVPQHQMPKANHLRDPRPGRRERP